MLMNEDANSIEAICGALQLPAEIQRSYSSFGVKRVYDWQRECLQTTHIINGNNLVYCAPTSGGKTLVAELLLLRTMLVKQKKVIFVLPYVSLVMEKERYLKRLLAVLNRSLPMRDRIKVRGFYGDQGGSRSYKEHVLVCTIEKANGIFNSLVMRGKAHQLGCVLFDEMHVLGNTFNGYLLEILISKIKFMGCKTATQQPAEGTKKQPQTLDLSALLSKAAGAGVNTNSYGSSSSGAGGALFAAGAASLQGHKHGQLQGLQTQAAAPAPPPVHVQMIAMSATMGNVEELARWLGGAIYRTTFRPVPLIERIKAGNELLDPEGRLLATLPTLPATSRGNARSPDPDPDHMLLLCQQALRQGQQVLVFCATKYACLQSCKGLVDAFTVPYKTPFNSSTTGTTEPAPVVTHMNLRVDPRATTTAIDTTSAGNTTSFVVDAAKRQHLLDQRQSLLSSLLAENPRLEETLRTGILNGVAYHNAGLSSGERQLVEKGFRSGAVSILAATSTLAAGVNLPAGRVLIRSMNIGKDYLNVMQYKQMCGRAGRMGQGGNIGESFLLVKAAEKTRALQLSSQCMPEVLSQLHPSADGGNSLLKALLEVVGLGLCGSVQEAMLYTQQTLLYAQSTRSVAVAGAGAGTATADSALIAVHTHADVVAVSLSILKFLVSARMLDCDNNDWLHTENTTSTTTTVTTSTAVGATVSATSGASVGQQVPSKLKITRFGRAIMQSNVDPDDAIVMYDSLLRAQDGLHLESSLHLLYLVTPLEHKLSPSFRKMLNFFESSRNSKNRLLANVFDAVGVEYAYLNKYQVSAPSKAMLDMCTSAVKLNSLYGSSSSGAGASTGSSNSSFKNMRREDWAVLSRCKRLWAALALQAVLDGKALPIVAREFDADAQDVSSLLHSAQIMCNKATRFCAQIGWTSMERMLSDFQKELENIEVNIESHESRSAGGAWGTTQQDSTQCSAATTTTTATAATAETAHPSAPSASSMTSATTGPAGAAKVATSRDEHTKQRLAMLVTTLQNSARELLRKEALTLDSRATAVMAALDASLPVIPGNVSNAALQQQAAARGAGASTVFSDDGDDEVLSEISDHDHHNDTDSEVSAEDTLSVANEDTEEREAMQAIAADMQRAASQAELFGLLDSSDTANADNYLYTADEYGSDEDAAAVMMSEDYLPTGRWGIATIAGPALPAAPFHGFGTSAITAAQGSLKRPHQQPSDVLILNSTIPPPISAPVVAATQQHPSASLGGSLKNYTRGDDRSPAPKAPKLLQSDVPSSLASLAYSQAQPSVHGTQQGLTALGRVGQYPPPPPSQGSVAGYVPRMNVPPAALSQQPSRESLRFPSIPGMLSTIAEHPQRSATASSSAFAPNGGAQLSSSFTFRSPHKGGLHRVTFSPLAKNPLPQSAPPAAPVPSSTEVLPVSQSVGLVFNASSPVSVPAAPATALAAPAAEFQFTISDEDLNALMEELESSGVLEFMAVGADVNAVAGVGAVPQLVVDPMQATTAEQVDHSTVDAYQMDVDSSQPIDIYGEAADQAEEQNTSEGPKVYTYYPLENPQAADDGQNGNTLEQVCSVYDGVDTSPAKSTSLTRALSSSAYKLSIQRIPSSTTGPGTEAGTVAYTSASIGINPTAEEVISLGAFERAVSKMMEDLEQRGIIPAYSSAAAAPEKMPTVHVSSPPTAPVPLSEAPIWLAGGTTEMDYFYGADTDNASNTSNADNTSSPISGYNEDSRDSTVSCSDVLKTGFAAAMSISQPLVLHNKPELSPSSAAHQHQHQHKLAPNSASEPRESGSKVRFAFTEQRAQQRLTSPYATPFTPSKITTPGRYLYFPLWQHDSVLKRYASQASSQNSPVPTGVSSPLCVDVTGHNPRNSPHAIPSVMSTTTDTLLAPSRSPAGSPRAAPALKPCYPSEILPPQGSDSAAALGFGMRRVSSPAHCRLFLEQLLSARCVSFELLYRPLPVHWLARYRSSPAQPQGSQSGQSVHSWTPYISWACCKLSSVTSCANDHFLDCSLNTDVNMKRNMFRSPHVLVGAALNFGDSYGYYLPLPCPLPLPLNPYIAESTATPSAPGADCALEGPIETLPARCRELIARYVGFGLLLNKCPGLRASRSVSGGSNAANSTCTTQDQVPNPLFLVSRKWAYSARRALLIAWRKGACTEWRLFGEIMQNAAITKVGMHLKSKLVVLRERDVLVEGPIEDPSIANVLLQQCRSDSSAAGDPHPNQADAASLQIPSFAHANKSESSSLSAYQAGQKVACFRAVAVFRAMALLEEQLRSCGAIDLFRNIEMLLLYCTSDAEYSGIRLDAPFFSRLRQGLKDRQQVIEQYFSALYGEGLNVGSPGDVAQLKRRLVSESCEQLQQALLRTGATGSVDVQAVTHFVSHNHPLLRLVSEHRSHVRTLPLCSAVLGGRCFDRVRAVYSTIGTETGRIILTNPPLQQVPKQCTYLPSQRASLHEELQACADANRRYALITYLNSKAGAQSRKTANTTVAACRSREQSEEEWVSVVSLSKTLQNLRRLQEGSDTSGAVADASRYEEYSYGRLVRVLDTLISTPAAQDTSDHHKDTSTTATAATSAATAAATPAGTSTALSTLPLPVQDGAGTSLVDVWRQAGYTYTPAEVNTMRQVLVEFPHTTNTNSEAYRSYYYAYPADKVFRCQAGHKPNAAEVGEINSALREDWVLSMLAPENSTTSTTDTAVHDTVHDTADGTSADDTAAVIQPAEVQVVNVRDGFRASEGYVLLAADYSQIELRILAHFSGDADLLQAFQQGDVFTAIAARWLHKAEGTITPAERNQVKQICYALIYGAGPNLVAEQANITVQSAQALMKDFLARYPGITKFLTQTKRQCRKEGCVETLLGRRRYLPGINSTDKQLKSKAERQAVNTLCQGSAADLIKLAMINIHTRLAQLAAPVGTSTITTTATMHSKHSTGEGSAGSADRGEQLLLQFRRPRSYPGGGLYKQLDDVRPVLQVHDELVFEVRHRDLHRVAAIVRDCMEHAVVLNVPLQVKLSSGASWGSLSPLLPPAHVDSAMNTVDTDLRLLRRSTQEGPEVSAGARVRGAAVTSASASTSISASPTLSGATATASSSLFAAVVGASSLHPLQPLQSLQQPLLFGYTRAGATQNAPPPQVGRASSTVTAVPPVVRDLFGKD